MDLQRNQTKGKRCAMDLISRQAVIDVLAAMQGRCTSKAALIQNSKIWQQIKDLPSVQPVVKDINVSCKDAVSRQAAIDAIERNSCNTQRAIDAVNALPSVQPQRTCVNCGRTANNGGWYADGRTRCPIEEHYALPKDGYCHLWEKRNVTDDDYPERREE